MIKLVVFDWNGTLLADVAATLEAANHELKVLGCPPIALTEYRQKFDVPVIKFFENMNISTKKVLENAVETAKAYHAYYEPRVVRCRTRSGTKTVLKWLKARKISAVLLSNHTIEGIYAQLARLRLENYFDAVLANDELHTSYTTGKQQRLIAYLKQTKHKAKETLIIGDSTEEVTIGKNLGLHTVAISGGHFSTDRLMATNPDHLINSLHQLDVIVETS